jgi:hypothetical protein
MELRPSISAFFSSNPSGVLSVYARYQGRHYETMIQDCKALHQNAPSSDPNATSSDQNAVLDDKNCKDVIFSRIISAGYTVVGDYIIVCMKGVYMEKVYHLHIVLRQKITIEDAMKTEIAMLKRQVTILQNDVTILQNENQLLRNENHTLRNENHTLRNENDLSVIENQFFKNEVARLREREFNRTHGVKGVDLMDLTN